MGIAVRDQTMPFWMNFPKRYALISLSLSALPAVKRQLTPWLGGTRGGTSCRGEGRMGGRAANSSAPGSSPQLKKKKALLSRGCVVVAEIFRAVNVSGKGHYESEVKTL